MTLITLYITAGCHLCELADKLLSELSHYYQFTVCYTETADDDNLLAQYGTKLLVIKFTDNSELNCSFSEQDIAKKLATQDGLINNNG